MFSRIRNLFFETKRVEETVAEPTVPVPKTFIGSVAALPPYDHFCVFEQGRHLDREYIWPVLTDDVREWMDFHIPGATVHKSSASNFMLEIWFETDEDRLLFKLTWGCFVHQSTD